MAGVARALSSGFPAAVAFNAGVITGDVIFLLLAVYGLSAVAELLGSVFFVVKIAGGVYLVWLGWKMWKRSSGHRTPSRSHNCRRSFEVEQMRQARKVAAFLSRLWVP